MPRAQIDQKGDMSPASLKVVTAPLSCLLARPPVLVHTQVNPGLSRLLGVMSQPLPRTTHLVIVFGHDIPIHSWLLCAFLGLSSPLVNGANLGTKPSAEEFSNQRQAEESAL